MEKLFKPYDKEFMKMAMIKHEETFKEQVYELHRLYQIQKILMKNIGRSRMKETHFSNQLESQNRRQFMILDLEQPSVTEDQFNKINIAEDSDDGDNNNNTDSNNNNNNNNNGVLEIIDETEIELTLGLGLGPTSYSRSRSRKTSDSGPSFSSSSTGSSQMNSRHHYGRTRETTRVELNDSSGRGHGQVLDATSSGYHYSSPSKNNIDDVAEGELRRERLKHHPPWLFQVLSLNMTCE
ncbi:uncharacterized protein LOC133808238 [Humulus lupulus]|uniref:uncharacterized protein LOC133808238 n=1 Tax=Humulus lupulus TaxID=3486 RepID=UPI002B413D73|nr:uncharacterized protein LOC133808238 [Humulus lupulus]XP_062101843.1 uncharacterized protein LOC133808238 [Humulus lupulus]